MALNAFTIPPDFWINSLKDLTPRVLKTFLESSVSLSIPAIAAFNWWCA